ncbi:MAG: peptidylprolyl isomerase [Flavobacteriales bacterium]
MKQRAWMTAAAVVALGMALSPTFAQRQSASTSGANPTETHVLEVGGELVTLADFKHVYGKNNRDSVYTVEALDEYMELFVNFKLKVLEAEALGMDTASAFKKELAGYRGQLARPYLVDGALLDALVDEAYDRKGTEVRASHILVSLDANASPADTLRAWNRIQGLRTRVENGEDFEAVARSKSGSDDPSVTSNGGDLGWFTAFQMVYPFECAAFNTPEGELSEVVRTKFGYHILQVTGKREARGEVQVAHIMVRMPAGAPQDQVANAEGRIQEVKRLLMSGESFDALAMKYSEDPSTASKGGLLPWFGTGKMVEEFENAAFDLKEPGDIAGPVRTDYGFHLLKLVEKKELPSLTESRRELSKKVRRDSRAEITKTSFVNKLKKEYGAEVSARRLEAIQLAAAKVDSLFYPGHPLEGVRRSEVNRTLFSVAGQERTVQDFVDWANGGKIRDLNRPTRELVAEEVDRYVEEELLAYEDTQLERKHNDFRLLMEEYHDGILLFELTDQKVWSRAVKDSAGLADFHSRNREQFMWPERLQAGIHTCEDAKIAKKVRKELKKTGDVEGLRRELIAERPLALRNEFGKFVEGDNTWADRAFEALRDGSLVADKNGLVIFETTEGGDQIILVHVQEHMQPTPKSLEECRGAAIAAYQDHLEKEWIMELQRKYPHKINREALYSLVR